MRAQATSRRNTPAGPRTVLSVLGARPQFVKAAVLSRQLRRREGLVERIVHTGQHYDAMMSQVFFDELGLPDPDFRLTVDSPDHAGQTARMLIGLEKLMTEQRPDAVLLYGDTNSTLAGALAAAKLGIPLVHVEAGLRSGDRRMPEQVNRIVTDRLSDLLLCPTQQAVDNLTAEGITRGVHLVGDVMYDAAIHFSDRAGEAAQEILSRLGLQPRGYVLWTCHRAANTDEPARLGAIMAAAAAVAREIPVVFPVHPRTRKRIAQLGDCPDFCEAKMGLSPSHSPSHSKLRLIEPVSYLEMLGLQQNARAVVTDSGGVQKEAFIFGVPCVTIRDQTEWTETVRTGANRLVAADAGRIIEAVGRQLARRDPLPAAAEYYGGGRAVARVVRLVAGQLGLEEGDEPIESSGGVTRCESGY